jgi:transcription antitermination factor NusG
MKRGDPVQILDGGYANETGVIVFIHHDAGDAVIAFDDREACMVRISISRIKKIKSRNIISRVSDD